MGTGRGVQVRDSSSDWFIPWWFLWRGPCHCWAGRASSCWRWAPAKSQRGTWSACSFRRRSVIKGNQRKISRTSENDWEDVCKPNRKKEMNSSRLIASTHKIESRWNASLPECERIQRRAHRRRIEFESRRNRCRQPCCRSDCLRIGTPPYLKREKQKQTKKLRFNTYNNHPLQSVKQHSHQKVHFSPQPFQLGRLS